MAYKNEDIGTVTCALNGLIVFLMIPPKVDSDIGGVPTYGARPFYVAWQMHEYQDKIPQLDDYHTLETAVRTGSRDECVGASSDMNEIPAGTVEFLIAMYTALELLVIDGWMVYNDDSRHSKLARSAMHWAVVHIANGFILEMMPVVAVITKFLETYALREYMHERACERTYSMLVDDFPSMCAIINESMAAAAKPSEEDTETICNTIIKLAYVMNHHARVRHGPGMGQGISFRLFSK